MPLARRDPGLLYALSLAVGASLDPAEAASAFAEVLSDRLGLAGVGVWVGPDEGGELAPLHTLGLPPDPADVPVGREAPVVEGGALAFPLAGAGVLVLRRDRPFSDVEADTLREVVDKFAVALRGALAHRQLQREAAERARAEAAERLAAERLAALIRENPNATLVETADRQVTLANQAFCDLFGIPAPPEALVGMDCAAAAEQTAALFADPGAFLDGVGTLLAERRTVTGEPIQMADGRAFERDYVPITLDGTYAGHLWEYRDVTARREADREIDRLRQFYEAVLQSMPAQLAVFDPDGRYRYVTPSAIQDPDVREALVGKTDEEYAAIRGLPAEIPRRRMQTIREVAESQRAVQFEESFQTRTGETRHFVRFVSPVVDEDGETVQVLGYGLDITERKVAEDALVASEALKRGVFESALDAVITIDTEGRVLEFNPAAEATFGHRAEDVVGDEMATLIVPERLRAAHRAGMARYLATGEGPVLGTRIEVPALRADGTEFSVELAINPVRLDDEREVFTATLRDITERKAAEEALRKSEARLRVALDAADLGTWDAPADGDGDLDARCKTIFGVAPDAHVTSDEILDRIHPDDRPAVEAGLAAAHQPDSDGHFEAEYRVAWPNDEVRWVAGRGLVLFEGEGDTRRPVRFVGTAQDVTERRHAAEALAESEQRYKQIVEHSQDLIYRADLFGRLTFVNAVGVHRAGYAEADLIGMPFWELVAERHRGEVAAFYARQIADQTPNTYLELPVETAGGETVWLGQNVQLLEEDGEPVGVQAVARDVTERRRVMDELVAARETAERAGRAREEFLANMSHEMRTPLNAVLGMGALLRETPLDDEQRHLLHALSFSADQLLALINDLLDVAKIESGQIQFERVPFRLGEVVGGVAEAVRFRADEKGLDLAVDVADDVPAHLVGDPVRLSQILLNLLSNAVKFTARGRVRLAATRTDAGTGSDGAENHAALRFTVEDTGVGIPADKLAAVFDRFTQAASDTTRKFGGTGLGLAIVKELTERQGGTVQVESVEGEGTRFAVTIPFAVAEEAPETVLTDDEADLSGARLLLVEDNLLNQFVARRMLEGWGAAVEIAENGREGVEAVDAAYASGRPFDLVLMDVQMPEMDGFEATRRIRQRHDAAALPILALTASALVEQRGQMEDAGMDDLVLKPFKPAHLRRSVAAHLGRAALPSSSRPPASAAGGPLVDLALLKENVGGDPDFILHLIGLFEDLVPTAVRDIEQALAAEDLPALASAAHKLKSSAGILGLGRLHTLLADLERLAEAGRPGPLPDAVEATVATAAAAVDELTRLRPTLAPDA